ncbi:MAG: hypothetical protein AAGJ46_11285 [Planctomycetota bacterium]
MPTRLTLQTPADFDLPRAVCSYGYFLLAPNRWSPADQSFRRPLWLDDSVANVTVTQSGAGVPVRVAVDRRLDRREQSLAKRQLTRVLRLDADLSSWRRKHPAAKRRGFGRMFRSPDLWEDMVKTITGCNVTWRNTITMNRLLVERIGGGAFPTPGQVARLTPSRLKARCRVGYRAARILRLARAIESGEVDLAWLESTDRTTDELYAELLSRDGFGSYAAANVLTLLGRYDRVPIDTETYRHYCQATGRERPASDKELDPEIIEHYGRYAPFQFLAYWFDLWRDYERRYGDAWTWDRDTTGASFTASVLNAPQGQPTNRRRNAD